MKLADLFRDLQKNVEILDSKFWKGTAAEKTLWDEVQKAILPKVEDSSKLLEIGSHKFNQLKEEVESILMTSGHYDPADQSPYLEKVNQDQLIMLKIILKLLHPNGRSHCSDSNIIETEASTESPNMSPDSNVIETEAPKSDIMTVNLKIQDTQLDPKQDLMPKKVIETEAPKSDMITVDLKTQGTQLNPNPMPKKTMTPRYKFKRIKKGGKVQKIQSPGIHKMKSKPHRNRRIYWSKKLWYANNISHDSNSFTLHNFCPMVTSNINGLYTVIHSQNMWLLRRPRVKIK